MGDAFPLPIILIFKGLKVKKTQSFFYGFTHIFGGDILQDKKVNIITADKALQDFAQKSQKIWIVNDKKYQQEIKQISSKQVGN